MPNPRACAGEANGLLQADRTPKVPLERIAHAVRESRNHILGGV